MSGPIPREKEFYGEALKKAKSGWKSTGYGMQINQLMRFMELTKQFPELLVIPVTEEQEYSLLDVGCGTGDLYTYLTGEGVGGPARYLGVDVLPEMVQQARENLQAYTDAWGGTGWDVQDGSISSVVGEGQEYDYVVSIAAYALKLDKESQMENLFLVQRDIDLMVRAAKKAVFVTLFSTWKNNIIPEEMVLDPTTMFAWAKTKWERVDLIHSYCPFDFSLVIYKEQSDWRHEWQVKNCKRG